MLPKYKKIVENAVRVCLEISAARKVPFDLLSDVSETLSKDSSELKKSFGLSGSFGLYFIIG